MAGKHNDNLCDEFLEWCETVGDDKAMEILQEICEAFYSTGYEGGSVGRVYVGDYTPLNAINKVVRGSIDIDGVVWEWLIQDGDWNGTEVREWGLEEEGNVGYYEPPPKPKMILVNTVDKFSEPRRWDEAEKFSKSSEGDELMRKYAYDKFVQPGGYIEGYWRKQAENHGVRISYEDNGD